uniref:centromere protein K n=1 Tax=Myxine glutinosa TaxID=7769 RepID=UPI00358E4048
MENQKQLLQENQKQLLQEKQKHLLHEVTMLEKTHAKRYQQLLAPDLLFNTGCGDAFEEDRLKQFYTKSLEELNELQASMCIEEHYEGEPSSTSRLFSEIFEARQSLLEGELQMNDDLYFEAQESQACALVVAEEEIQLNTQQMEKTLEFLRTQNEELKLNVERETCLIAQYKEINAVLEKKKQLCKSKGEDANQRAQDEMNKKISKAKGYYDKLQKLLTQFVSDYYPQPPRSIASHRANQKRSTLQSSESGPQLLSLLEILQLLMNKILKCPHDPYILVDETFYPHYLETLLRYGIAVAHPDDPHKIRLESYHEK